MFFGWLLVQAHVHMLNVLLQKKVSSTPPGARYPMCGDPWKRQAARLWAAVGNVVPPDAHMRDLDLLADLCFS
jgi:hypothetical protein